MKLKESILFFITALLFSACSHSALSGNDYVAYVENEKNELVKSKEIENLDFQLQYCTTEYMLLRELKTDHIPQEVMDQRKKENDSMVFFRLRIKTKDNSDVINYKTSSAQDSYSRMQYLSYDFEQDIALYNGTDTIFPAMFHFERTYGITPYADFMLAFDSKLKPGSEFQVLIDDKIYNTGLLKFTYNTKDIKNIPPLKNN